MRREHKGEKEGRELNIQEVQQSKYEQEQQTFRKNKVHANEEEGRIKEKKASWCRYQGCQRNKFVSKVPLKKKKSTE